MALTNTARSYGAVARVLHWLTALLILAAIPLGLLANDLAHRIENPEISVTAQELARAATLFSAHKTVGVAAFLVALLRIAWALSQPRPGLLNADRKAEALLAETIHWLLYGSLVLVPLTGWIHHAATTGYAPILWPFGQSLPFVPKSPALAETFAGLHDVLGKVLAAAILLHVAGALKHHVIDRDATLRRMISSRTDFPQPPAARHGLAAPLLAMAIWGGVLGLGAALGAFGKHESGAQETTALQEVASEWQVDEGTLALEIRQMGSAVTGQFRDWTAQITFTDRPDPGSAGSVVVTVAIPSLELGTVSRQAMGPDYFDAESHPTARFEAGIRRTQTGWEAVGPLTIRGASQKITLPFSLEIQGNSARMAGVLTLDRMDFGIGRSVPEDATLGHAVEVRVELTATRREG